MCGLNNKWQDPFPTCVPTKFCEVPSDEVTKTSRVMIDFNDLYSYDGRHIALNGTKAIYSCIEDEKNLTMFGDSIRICQANGVWSGEAPACYDHGKC